MCLVAAVCTKDYSHGATLSLILGEKEISYPKIVEMAVCIQHQSLWLKSASALESLLYAIGKFCIGQWGRHSAHWEPLSPFGTGRKKNEPFDFSSLNSITGERISNSHFQQIVLYRKVNQ